jgi:hypothetical protein
VSSASLTHHVPQQPPPPRIIFFSSDKRDTAFCVARQEEHYFTIRRIGGDEIACQRAPTTLNMDSGEESLLEKLLKYGLLDPVARPVVSNRMKALLVHRALCLQDSDSESQEDQSEASDSPKKKKRKKQGAKKQPEGAKNGSSNDKTLSSSCAAMTKRDHRK